MGQPGFLPGLHGECGCILVVGLRQGDLLEAGQCVVPLLAAHVDLGLGVEIGQPSLRS